MPAIKNKTVFIYVILSLNQPIFLRLQTYKTQHKYKGLCFGNSALVLVQLPLLSLPKQTLFCPVFFSIGILTLVFTT
jgi:hypothetical protein